MDSTSGSSNGVPCSSRKRRIAMSQTVSMTSFIEALLRLPSALIRGKVEDFKRVTKYRLYTCVHPEPPKKKR